MPRHKPVVVRLEYTSKDTPEETLLIAGKVSSFSFFLLIIIILLVFLFFVFGYSILFCWHIIIGCYLRHWWCWFEGMQSKLLFLYNYYINNNQKGGRSHVWNVSRQVWCCRRCRVFFFPSFLIIIYHPFFIFPFISTPFYYFYLFLKRLVMTAAVTKPSKLRIIAELGFVRNSIGSDAFVSDEIITSHAGYLFLTF